MVFEKYHSERGDLSSNSGEHSSTTLPTEISGPQVSTPCGKRGEVNYHHVDHTVIWASVNSSSRVEAGSVRATTRNCGARRIHQTRDQSLLSNVPSHSRIAPFSIVLHFYLGLLAWNFCFPLPKHEHGEANNLLSSCG